MNQDLYTRRKNVSYSDRKQIITPINSNEYSSFRLDPNWDSENERQIIRLAFALDEIDGKNIKNINDNIGKISTVAGSYTTM
jgi:hypothetical protein